MRSLSNWQSDSGAIVLSALDVPLVVALHTSLAPLTGKGLEGGKMTAHDVASLARVSPHEL
jgi:hypothetical protein